MFRRIALSFLLLSSPVLAADGAGYTGTGFGAPAAKMLLCDSKTTTGACAGGLGISPPEGYKVGSANFEIAKDTNCSACTVEIRFGSGTDEQHLVKTLTCAGTTSWTLEEGLGIAGKIYPNVTVATGCTDLDVVGHFQMNP